MMMMMMKTMRTNMMMMRKHLFSAGVSSGSGETEAWVNAVNWSSIARWHRVPDHDDDDGAHDDVHDDTHDDDDEEFLRAILI